MRAVVQREGGRLIKVNGRVVRESADFWYGVAMLKRLVPDIRKYDDVVELIAAIGRAERARRAKGGASTGAFARRNAERALRLRPAD